MRRELVVDVAFVAIGHCDLQRSDTAQLVELGKEDIGQRVEPRRVAKQNAVEPAHAALPPGYRPELSAELSLYPAQLIGDVTFDLGRERPGADARAVRLRRADATI